MKKESWIPWISKKGIHLTSNNWMPSKTTREESVKAKSGLEHNTRDEDRSTFSMINPIFLRAQKHASGIWAT